MEDDWFLADSFEAHRGHIRSVAYRILGSVSEADDAVQGTWLRLSGSDPDRIENLGGWLTTAVAGKCLDILPVTPREDPLDVHVPDPIVTLADEPTPRTTRWSPSSWGSPCWSCSTL